ncbi:hypothetical protein SDC9_101956 [bioreactor metagenome]|uniref:Uncharacterized protein n=1 Tax=bioreactor metagenome TaxID=1076179 RepID=A0A645AW78_9ZZZZ
MDRLLPQRGVGHQQHFVGADRLPHPDQLLNHRLVDLQPPGGIEDHHIAVVEFGFGNGIGGNARDVEVAAFGMDRYADLPAEDFQLVDGGGTVDVARGQQH